MINEIFHQEHFFLAFPLIDCCCSTILKCIRFDTTHRHVDLIREEKLAHCHLIFERIKAQVVHQSLKLLLDKVEC